VTDVFERAIANLESKLRVARSLISLQREGRDIVEQLRTINTLMVAVDDGELARVCDVAAMEIERLRSGLTEIAGMGSDPFSRQSVRAREIVIGSVDQSPEESP
jgi:hypothetical protein